VGFLCLTSCGKIHCPGFPEHLLGYLPYKIGDTLTFVNQHDDTVSFRVRRTEVETEHTVKSCGECACGYPYFSFVTEGCKDSFKGGIDIVNKQTKSILWIQIQNCYFDNGDGLFQNNDGYRTKGSDFRTETDKNSFDKNNNAIFGTYVIFEDDNYQINKLIIIKGIGIVEFYDQKYNFQWKNIEYQK